MGKVRTFEAFAGIGSQLKSWQNIGIDCESVGIAEVNEYAILSYDAIFNNNEEVEEKTEDEMQEYLKKLNIPLDDKGKRVNLKKDRLRNFYKAVIRTKNFGDISKIETKELPEIDLFTFSFPCLTKDNLVLTKEGYKNIDKVRVGDYVLTHKGRWRQVLRVMNNGFKKVVKIKSPFFDFIEITLNHKVFVNNKEWKEVRELKKTDLLTLRLTDIFDNSQKSYEEVKNDRKYSYEEYIKLLKMGFRGDFKKDKNNEFFFLLNNELEKYKEEKDVILVPFTEIEYIIEEKEVFDLEIEEDHSFTVQNIVVHNCQDISLAGKQRGFQKGTNTRSSLLWECKKIIEDKKPKFLLMENVKALVSKKFKEDFEVWLDTLKDLGYNTYWKVLNAKDFEIPQNRERVFAISIRENIDEGYKFPEKRELKKRLKDILEKKVDEKFYLSQEQIDRINFSTYNQNKTRIQGEISQTLCARDWKDPKCVKINFLPIKVKTKVRKNEVRVKELQDLLIKSKEKSKLTIKEISKSLNLPETKVEHWFRRDKSFVIPLEDKWEDLKRLLNIKDKTFDKEITEFIIKDSNYDMNQRLYDTEKESPTILGSNNIKIKEDIEQKRLFGIFDKENERHQAGSVWDKEGLSPTLDTMKGGWRQPSIVEEVINPLKDKTDYGWHFEQNIYDDNGITRSLKASQGSGNIPKTIENYPKPTLIGGFGAKWGEQWKEGKRIYDSENISVCLRESSNGNNWYKVEDDFLIGASRGRDKDNPSSREKGINCEQRFEPNKNNIANTLTTVQKDNYLKENKEENFRVRKLTPKECWRLMGFSDEDFEKAEKVCSNSQLYKQAGNSIVVNVLMAIFENMKEYF